MRAIRAMTKLRPRAHVQIALEQIRARSRKFLARAIVGAVLCLAFFGLAAYAISRATPSTATATATATSSTETERGVAFLLGYEGALTLARAKMGEGFDQGLAAQAQRLKILGIDEITYPTNPMGEFGDAALAAEFARTVSGALEARNPVLAKAFQLGWIGVISKNTPSLAFPGFSVRGFACEAGFPTSEAVSDAALLEHIASAARGPK